MFDAMKDNAGALIAFLFIVDLLLVAAVFVLFRQLSLLRRNINILKRGADGSTLLDKVSGHTVQIEELYRKLDEQAAQKDYLTEVLAGSLQRVAVVRYDAFEDMGGKLSFSIAMMDENGDGVVITSIYARDENRSYAKAIRAGSSTHVLSREEEEAVHRALHAKPPLIRTRKGQTSRLFDIQQTEGEGEASAREDDGSWVM
ncbi:MAG: DUF4446 family protein [Actinomycetota bacterium]|nr:DUF4446 family protein [Actinomycetota bacterium]